MTPADPTPPETQTDWVCHFRSGDSLRRRSIGAQVQSSQLAVPAPAPRLLADWRRDMASQLALAPGDVEPLPLGRTRARWPALRDCEQAVVDWLAGLGLPRLLDRCEVALMACRGARYHHDAQHYGAAAFCNLFLGEGAALDLCFPSLARRMPLSHGSVVLFDTAQPHAVLARERAHFNAADFAADPDRALVFLSWELPIEQAEVAQLLGLELDVPGPPAAPAADEIQVWHGSQAVRVCADTGRWLAA